MFGSNWLPSGATVFETGVNHYVIDCPWFRKDRAYYRKYVCTAPARRGEVVHLHIVFNQNAAAKAEELRRLQIKWDRAIDPIRRRTVALRMKEVFETPASTYFVGTEIDVTMWRRARLIESLGVFGVLVRKLATVAFTRNAATAGREQSINNGKDSDAAQRMAGPTGV